jgi:hypothetical protein
MQAQIFICTQCVGVCAGGARKVSGHDVEDELTSQPALRRVRLVGMVAPSCSKPQRVKATVITKLDHK